MVNPKKSEIANLFMDTERFISFIARNNGITKLDFSKIQPTRIRR